ncbi:MAG: dihydropteroate synthase [Hyphomicrobiales bacterium]|nr:dihydropteroate synthase [Hyphomicrobiales bacterium]
MAPPLPIPPAEPARLAPPWPTPTEARALIMGIVNVTPDSFSDGGRFLAAEDALAQGLRLAGEGADILDIGGESTRPGHVEVPADEEIRRVLPVIEGLARARPDLALSIDTTKAEVARRAIAAGARIINDVWGLQRDPTMAGIAAETGAGLVIMHNRADKDPGCDIVADMERFFERSLTLAARAGLDPARIALDPGIGFGKSFEQNLAAIRAIPRLRRLGHAVLLGLSRKSFLGLITVRPVEGRGAATLAADCFGLLAGADVIRVHDVAPHRDAALLIAALARDPA